jgi:hypothetical protein
VKGVLFLSIAILLSAVPCGAQTTYAYEVRIDRYYKDAKWIDLSKESIDERTVLLYPPIDLSEGGTFRWKDITFYIRNNDMEVYQWGHVGEGPVGVVTELQEKAVLLLELSFYDTIEEKGYGPELFAFECSLDGERHPLDEPLGMGDDGKPENAEEIEVGGQSFYVNKGDIKVYEDKNYTKERGELLA